MPEEQDPLIGLSVRDYVLTRQLGKGAMGVVYLAQHPQTGQEIAIKFLSGEAAAHTEFVSRFINEAASSAALDHPNIIRVFEAGQDDGTHFMMMEYVDGVDLGHFLEVQEKVKESQILPWIKQSAQAIAYAHSCGIIHRDLKPTNIMLNQNGEVKIADLGLSKNLEAGGGDLSMTMSGTVIGTPYYISPEQARDAKHVDARTDIYSLGATFYHLVTGRPPFGGHSAAEVMSKHMNEQLVSPQRRNNNLSDGISDLLMKMMEKDPDKRFQSMEELVSGIERLERGERVIEKKVKLRDSEEHSLRSSRLKFRFKFKRKHLIRLALVAGLIGLGFYLSKTSPPSDTPPSVTQKTPDIVPTPKPSPQVTLPPQDTTSPPVIPSKPDLTASNNAEEGEEIAIQMAEETKPKAAPKGFNWVDLYAALIVFVGITAAKQVGWMWGSLRALAFWVAVWVLCSFFGELAEWFRKNLALSKEISYPSAFIVLTIALFLPAWIATYRIRGHEKQTWQVKMNQLISILPGIVIGAALAAWLMALLAILVPNSVPVDKSWVGSQVLESFPSIEKASKIARANK
jgi:serine/threonine protein kinase